MVCLASGSCCRFGRNTTRPRASDSSCSWGVLRRRSDGIEGDLRSLFWRSGETISPQETRTATTIRPTTREIGTTYPAFSNVSLQAMDEKGQQESDTDLDAMDGEEERPEDHFPKLTEWPRTGRQVAEEKSKSNSNRFNSMCPYVPFPFRGGSSLSVSDDYTINMNGSIVEAPFGAEPHVITMSRPFRPPVSFLMPPWLLRRVRKDCEELRNQRRHPLDVSVFSLTGIYGESRIVVCTLCTRCGISGSSVLKWRL